jgi:hypothetical protein
MVETANTKNEIGKSLVDDDVSTVNNNTSNEETLASEDPIPLRHETYVFHEKPSEHSRLLTDDETSYRSWMNKDNRRHFVDGSSSVNTGSTYEESPFVLRTHRKDPEEERQDHQQTQLGQQNDHQRNNHQLSHSGACRMAQLDSSHSRTAEDNGYACEMFLETQSMLQKTKTDMGKLSRQLFERKAEQNERSNNNAPTNNTALGNVQAILGACGDKIDAVLIKLFNVHPEDEINTSRPNYSVSVNDSVTRETIQFPEQKSTATKSSSTVGYKEEKTTANTYLVFLNDNDNNDDDEDDDDEEEEEANPSIHESESDELRNSESDVRDDLEDVLADDYDEPGKTMSNDSQDSVQRFKESLYATRGGKAENEDDDEEDDDVRDSLPNEIVSSVLQKYEGRSTGKNVESNNVIVFDNTDVGTNDYSWNLNFSRIHKKHVVDLINKNLAATNRSGPIDLSNIGPIDEGSEHNTVSDSSSKESTKDKPMMTTVGTIDVFNVTATSPTTYSSSFLSSPLDDDDEIEVNFRKRREKLRKMMADLNLSMGDPKTAVDSEDRDYKTYRDNTSGGELRTSAAALDSMTTEYRSMKPIDLTMYEEIDLTMY